MVSNMAEGKKKVLVIDDSGMVLRHIKEMISDEYEVSIAVSGALGLKQLEKVMPDVILLDYEMPDMNGKETFEAIRATKAGKSIPIIYLTSMDDKNTIASLLEQKPQGYLMKPAIKVSLLEAIAKALQ